VKRALAEPPEASVHRLDGLFLDIGSAADLGAGEACETRCTLVQISAWMNMQPMFFEQDMLARA